MLNGNRSRFSLLFVALAYDLASVVILDVNFFGWFVTLFYLAASCFFGSFCNNTSSVIWWMKFFSLYHLLVLCKLQ